MEQMNARFSKRGLHLTMLDYALVAAFVVQTVFAVVTVSLHG